MLVWTFCVSPPSVWVSHLLLWTLIMFSCALINYVIIVFKCSVPFELVCLVSSVHGWVVCYSVLVDYHVDLLNIACLRLSSSLCEFVQPPAWHSLVWREPVSFISLSLLSLPYLPIYFPFFLLFFLLFWWMSVRVTASACCIQTPHWFMSASYRHTNLMSVRR